MPATPRSTVLSPTAHCRSVQGVVQSPIEGKCLYRACYYQYNPIHEEFAWPTLRHPTVHYHLPLPQRPPRALALPRLGAAAPWPPLVLALLTLLALIAAYSVRPTVQVDLGDYYDSIYVQASTPASLMPSMLGRRCPGLPIFRR
ncbi:MAG: hypothetical protein HC893_03610 [Chloroflexaceae bacterium]|nr:hypothetical protein [Chloroflexaceae bacterium]